MRVCRTRCCRLAFAPLAPAELRAAASSIPRLSSAAPAAVPSGVRLSRIIGRGILTEARHSCFRLRNRSASAAAVRSLQSLA